MPYWGKARLCFRCGKRKHWGGMDGSRFRCRECWKGYVPRPRRDAA